MYIKDFKLYNFRNYRDQKIELTQGINLLVGSNGQGKTNILEGIYYLITGKSNRIRQEKELIFWGEKNFYLKGSFQVTDRIIKLESYYETSKKVMKINQLACKRLSDYVGTVNVVFFSPDDLNIVKKSPLERRHFLDLLIYQIKPTHIAHLNSYLRITRQKNNLLKQEKNLTALRNQLQIWNEQLVEVGSKIIINRSSFVEKLNSYCRPIFYRIFSQQHHLDIHYLALGNKSKDEALSTFPEILSKNMNQEIERKTVIYGPHRDDLMIEINGKSARLFASQGQQRTVVLCLKLAEMEIILKEKGDYPILLLDDVFSELDEYRRDYLLRDIHSKNKQTIMTMTEADSKMVNDKEITVFKVSNGNIRRGN